MERTIDEYEELPFRVMDRLYKLDGSLVVQADVEEVCLSVIDTTGGAPVTIAHAEPVNVDDDGADEVGTIFDTLQTPDSWTRDTVGANFIHDLDADLVTLEGGKVYRLEYTFRPVSELPERIGPVVRLVRIKGLLTEPIG